MGEEMRNRNELQDEISSLHRSIHEKLNEHSAVASDLQRQVENNEKSMWEKLNDHYSTQQSLHEFTQRLADNQKSVDDRVNNLIVGKFAATGRTATLEEVQSLMPTVNVQNPVVQGEAIMQIRPLTASSTNGLTCAVPHCVPVQ